MREAQIISKLEMLNENIKIMNKNLTEISTQLKISNAINEAIGICSQPNQHMKEEFIRRLSNK